MSVVFPSVIRAAGKRPAAVVVPVFSHPAEHVIPPVVQVMIAANAVRLCNACKEKAGW